MVGSLLVCALTGKLAGSPPQACLPETVRTLTQTWEARTVWQGDQYRLSYWKYDAYPICSFETQDFFLYLEGRLYGLSTSQVRSKLLHLAHAAASPDAPNALAGCLEDLDGDFLIFIFNKTTNTIFVINDLFARLPAYYYQDRHTLVIARNIDQVLENSPKTCLDSMSLAQYLVFGFPLGPRTLFQDIYTLPPASLLTIDLPQSRATLAPVLRHNLEDKKYAVQTLAVNAGHLVELFRSACARRLGAAGPNVVSLSGGLDSRAVAACLSQAHQGAAAASFLDYQGDNHGDFQVARQVAAHLHLPWYSFQLAPPREQEVDALLHLKQGANSLEMSFILDFLARLQRTFGADLTYFTGDGGGDTLGESRPYRHLGSFPDLLHYLVQRYQIFPLEVAASLTGVPAQDLLAAAADLVAAYPETAPARKYQHFFCMEVAVKQYNEGEDRNRQYFWSVSPFYALPFFTYALACPDHQKLGLRLYRTFLDILSPGLSRLPYANWGAPLGSLKFACLYAAKSLSRMRPDLTRRLKRLLAPPTNHTHQFFPSQALKKQVLASPCLTAYLDEAALKNLMQNIDTLSVGQKWTLFTLTSLMGEVSPRSRTPEFSLMKSHGARP